jgi:hypothetical protein
MMNAAEFRRDWLDIIRPAETPASDDVRFDVSDIRIEPPVTRVGQSIEAALKHWQTVEGADGAPIPGLLAVSAVIKKHSWSLKEEASNFQSGREGLKCDICEEEEAAVVRCVECEELMCEACSRPHSKSKASRDHHLQPVEEFKAQGAEAGQVVSTDTSPSRKKQKIDIIPPSVQHLVVKHKDTSAAATCGSASHPIFLAR